MSTDGRLCRCGIEKAIRCNSEQSWPFRNLLVYTSGEIILFTFIFLLLLSYPLFSFSSFVLIALRIITVTTLILCESLMLLVRIRCFLYASTSHFPPFPPFFSHYFCFSEGTASSRVRRWLDRSIHSPQHSFSSCCGESSAAAVG